MSDSNKTLKIGMIGVGSSAINIAETIANVDGVDLIALSAKTVEEAEELSKKYAIDFVTDNYKKLCEKPDIDFVVISTPHALHHQMALYALNQGKHVLVEKPIATKVEHAEEMIKLAQEKDLKLGVHFQCRFFGAVKKAQEMIENGELGKILQVNVSVMWYRPPSYYANNWKGTWDLEGGSSLINQAIHPVDEMVHLVGDVKTVFGFKEAKIHDIETEDNTAAVFQFENGAFGTIQTSTASKAAFPAKLTIFGSEKGIEIDGNILTVFNEDDSTDVHDFTGGGQVGSAKDPKKFSLQAHSDMMKDFRDAILEDRDPEVTGEQGLKSLKVVCAIYEADGKKIINL